MNIVFHQSSSLQNVVITSLGFILLFLTLYFLNIKFVLKVLKNVANNHYHLAVLNTSLESKNQELLYEK